MGIRAGRTFDVLVVGSGASGGWAAKRLAEAGAEVGLLDAGRVLTHADYTEHRPGYDLKYRDMAPEVIRKTRHRQKDCYACMEWNWDWFRSDLAEPYTTAARMGKDRSTSVLNQYQQSWDVDNLFVMDGAGSPPGAARTRS